MAALTPRSALQPRRARTTRPDVAGLWKPIGSLTPSGVAPIRTNTHSACGFMGARRPIAGVGEAAARHGHEMSLLAVRKLSRRLLRIMGKSTYYDNNCNINGHLHLAMGARLSGP